MKTRTAATAATLTLLLALVGCAPTGTSPDHGDMPGMNNGDASATVEANAADVMFAQMMIPHHEQAIEMADVLLAKEGIAADVAALAERIKAAQQPEIELMEGWLEDWGVEMPEGAMDHGDGMMSQADMDALENAGGAEASGLFLDQMIEHHEGAIDMAEAQIAGGENADAIALAEKIVADQTAEIDEMRELLAGL
jgi:uncharacterized protein (DUF305 family)